MCDIADALWSRAIRADWNHKCAVCGKGQCEAHHLIPRQFEATRYEMRNGIALCARHHQFDADVSPHQNAAGWLAWLKANQPLRHAWYTRMIADNEHRKFDGTKNPVYYCDIIRRFRQYVEPDVFDAIVGMKFSTWLKGTP